ncbi:hypothetical protein JCM10212_006664 [Sporobolomyces blumeae]
MSSSSSRLAPGSPSIAPAAASANQHHHHHHHQPPHPPHSHAQHSLSALHASHSHSHLGHAPPSRPSSSSTAHPRSLTNGLAMHPSAVAPPPPGPPSLVGGPMSQQTNGPPGHAPGQPGGGALGSMVQAASQPGAGGPGGPPGPGGVPIAPPHPSAARLNDLLEFVKAEFEQVAGEGGVLRAQREEYEAMIHSHAGELNAMRAMAYELERKYHDDKRVLQDENSRSQDEIARLRQQLDSARTSVSSSASGLAPPASTLGGPSPHARPTLPSLMGSTPQPSVRPASTGPSAGMFGGGAASHIGEREREYAAQQAQAQAQQAYANGMNGRVDGTGDHPNKRSRIEEDDRRKPPGPQRHGSALPSYAAGPRPSSTGPPGSAHGSTPLHHPSPHAPAPPSSNLAPISHPTPSPAPPAFPPASSAATTVKEEKPLNALSSSGNGNGHGAASNVEVTNFDPETAPKDLKKEGSDWMTMFNPNVKRVLDVGLVHTLVHDSVVCCVRFSPDGKILATGCNRNTTLYDTKTGAKISTLFDESSGANNDNYIRSASFSPDGKFLATGSEDRIVRIWNLSQKRISQIFQGHKSEIYSLAFSPDGRRLVSGSGDKTARMWDLESGSCMFTLAIEDITIAENGPVDAGVTSVVLSPDGKFLAAGSLDTVVRIWDAETGHLLDKLKGHKDSVYSVAFSPDGKFLVSGSLDKTLKMWDMASLRTALQSSGGKDAPVGEGGKTNCLTTLQGHKDYVLSVDISPDGAWIVSGSKDRGVQFWDPKTAKAQFMLQGHKNSVISVAVSDAGGLVATGSGDWSARIWSYERIA